MSIKRNLQLHEWIKIGKRVGKIRKARTVVLAYCMDECTVLPLIVNIVKGDMAEEDALIFMERVIYFGTEGSGGTPSLS
jgi:hypothetical protein